MNIMVAEDEPLALDDILAMLQPFAKSHHILGFGSGEEVLACARSVSVDLLITDIRMPEMDGLELIQRLRERGGHFAALVLSGYGEFEYARAGLRLGVTDYLLKPIITETLQQTVERALATLVGERRRRELAHDAELARVLMGQARSESLLAGDWGLVVTVCENWDSPTTWQTTSVDRAFVLQAIADERPKSCEIVDLDGQRRIILVPAERAQPPQVEMLALRVHQAILSAGVIVHTAYECKHAGDDPAQALRRALDRLGRSMRLGAPTFVRLDHAPSRAEEPVSSESRELLARSLGRGTTSAVRAEIRAALDQLRRQQACQPVIVQTLVEIFDVLRQHIDRDGADCLPARDATTAAVRACRTYSELVAWVDAQIRILEDHSQFPATPRDLVGKLVARMQASCADDISLQAFTAEHGVSLAYFSRLFKDQTGMTFSDYQIQVRIAKARELLARPNLRLADVSALVGYGDPKYFSQVFRKVVGVPPLDYQRSLQQQIRPAQPGGEGAVAIRHG